VAILLAHPEIPSCEDCRSWLYRDDWTKSTRAGSPVPRPPGTPLPCHQCPKSHDARPHPEIDLTPRHRLALNLYYQVRAGLPMPDDGAVRRNCGLIHQAAEAVGRHRSDMRPFLSLLLMATTPKARR
jgi:hypothetical protein